MREEDKAYIAGIVDGEGSIMLERIHKNQHPSPVVSVTSTTPEQLEKDVDSYVFFHLLQLYQLLQQHQNY